MFSLQSLFQNLVFISIITILLGLGLASIFGVECHKSSNCNIYRSPEALDGKSYRWKTRCYSMAKTSVLCPSGDKQKHVIESGSFILPK